jgi:predicted nucleic acid-binding protein
MNKVLIDTNVWVDIVLNRPAFVDASKGAVLACIEDDMQLFIAATSLKDVFYFAERSAGADAAYQSLELLFQIAKLAPVDELVCKAAMKRERPDYEDGIVAACVEMEGIDTIITRDEAAFNDGPFSKFTPAEFLSHLGYEPISL